MIQFVFECAVFCDHLQAESLVESPEKRLLHLSELILANLLELCQELCPKVYETFRKM